MKMLKAKIFKIAEKQGISPHQMILRAIFRSVDDVHLIPEFTIGQINEKIYHLKSLLEIGK